MAHRGRFPRFLIVTACTLAALPLFAQQPPAMPSTDDRIQQLEQRLEQLNQQVAQIRQELDAIKAQSPTAAATPASAPAEEDLTKVDVATAAPQTPAPTAQGEQPASALTDVQTVNNVPNPGASKVFNPDTSVIGNFLAKAGQHNAFEFPGDSRPPMTLDEAEVAFEAFVDPYAKGKFFISITPEGVDVEEGFANFVALPWDLTAKVGKMKATFGKANTWHTHVRPWADQPLVIHNFLGDEGLNDSGVSISKSFANPWNAYIEATGEAFSGNVDNVFERRSDNDLFYNAHLKVFKDLSENSNLEVGTSFSHGSLAGGTLDRRGSGRIAGVDVTYRWKPLSQGLYRGFIGRFEGLVNDRGLSRNLKGFYLSGDYQLGQRWFTGLRLDAADRDYTTLNDARVDTTDIFRDRGLAATLTFWPSEFSQIRSELRRIRYGDAKSVTEFLVQLQFAIGAHGAHSF